MIGRYVKIDQRLRFHDEAVFPMDWALALAAPLGLAASSEVGPMAPVLGGDVPLSMWVRISFVYLSLR